MSESLFTNLANGFSVAATPENLLFGIIGVVLGTAVGVLPGLGPAVAISLLLPLTFGLDPIAAFIMFGGIYYGAMFGGATTAILVNTPGCSSSAVTTFDGHPLAKQGRAGTALSTAIISSFVGGTFATLALMLLAPSLVELSLLFGPPEYFALMLLALVLVSTIGGASLSKSVFATFLGFAISLIGIDMQTGVSRMTFDIPELYSGINVVLAGIGLFAVGEVLWVMSGGGAELDENAGLRGSLFLTLSELKKSAMAWLRGTVLGFFAGILPGSGGTLAGFMAYGVEQRFSKTPDKFGSGLVEGVAAPESANNAAAGGSMVPLLALGIPGSATTAVMLVAFQIYGCSPARYCLKIAAIWLRFDCQPVYRQCSSGSVQSATCWSLGAFIDIAAGLLYGCVLVFSSLGAYSLKGSIGDVFIVYVLGSWLFVCVGLVSCRPCAARYCFGATY